jgi:hypothetical protein
MMLLAAPLLQAAHNMCAPILCGPLQSIAKLLIARGVLMGYQQLVTCIPKLVLGRNLQGLFMFDQQKLGCQAGI